MTTEMVLGNWRYGPIQAERLCAGLLEVAGYQDVDPQATLGGPDGKKDILARRDDQVVVAAVYFPPTSPSFGEIRAKFVSDRAGVAANNADGFVFFVNQYLTVGQRAELQARGSTDDQIYHLERIRHLLDSPIGYGMRLQYLRLPMSSAEQASFFNAVQQDKVHQLLRNLQQSDHLWDADSSAISQLNASVIQLVHRAMAGGGHQRAIGGQFRAVQTAVVGPDGTPRFIHPPPEEVPGRLSDLLVWWRQAYSAATPQDSESVLRLLAQLHHGLVTVAPFMDFNGRLARLVVDQAARELLGSGIAPDLIADLPVYYAALRSADDGELEDLIRLMRAALERQPG